MLPNYFIFLAPCLIIYSTLYMMDAFSAHSRQLSSGLKQTTAIVEAAKAFLELLDENARAQIQFPYVPQSHATPILFPHPRMPKFNFVGEQYGQSVWSNFPVSDVPRPGVRLGNTTAAQKDSAMNLLRVILSDRGFSKVQDIMGSDQALADTGVPYAAGRAAYTLAFFGEPSLTDVWMVQFGGHHLALNVAIHRDAAVIAPVLTGAMPAIFTENGIKTRVLANENDKAFTLFSSFNDSQRQAATFDHPVSDMLLGPGEDSKDLPAATGVQASSLDPSQQAILLDLISESAGTINDVHAAPRLAEIRDGLQDTYFAWSGPSTCETGKNGASYFRVQGPNLFIEFAPQFPGGDLTMHVHTIYRDPLRAYGRAFSKDHSLADVDTKELL